MIVVEANLRSAFSESRDQELCRVEIVNQVETTVKNPARGDYQVRLYSRNGRLIRTTEINNWPRNALPAWRLVAEAFAVLRLEAMG